MRRIWLIFSQWVTLALVLGFVVHSFKPHWIQAALQGWIVPQAPTLSEPEPQPTGSPTPPPLSAPPDAGQGFRYAVQTAAPAVVSINASKKARQQKQDEDWLNWFFGPQGQQPQRGMGSGVVVSAEGYVLTNHHVIEGMDEIEVQLHDGRKAKAEVMGRDPESDLAVLKVDMPHLPAITWGDSDALQVGDAVLAIGNPFGVGQTVTSGIVSGLRRHSLGINTFEDFIQTDAAINPGNSGGALVDTQGRLLGINTAIYTRSGGSMGIGFAIPASLARQVLDSLLQDGHVSRGWIGVELQDLSPELAQVLQVPEGSQGSMVRTVLDGGPAQQAGLKVGDVVQSVDGRSVRNMNEMIAAVVALKPGESSTFVLLRKGQQLSLQVQAGQRPKQR